MTTSEKMEIRQISPEEYETFTNRLDYNPIHGIGQYNQMKIRGYDSQILGGFENGKLRIAMIVRKVPAMKVFKWAYSPYGWIADQWNDYDMIQAFLEGLKDYWKNEKIMYLRFESDIALRQRDTEGQVVEDGWNHEDHRSALIDMGLEAGELKADGYDLSKQSRWSAVLDLAIDKEGFTGLPASKEKLENKDEAFEFLDDKTLLKNMAVRTRYDVKRSMRPYIKVRTLKEDEMDILMEMEENAAQFHEFEASGSDQTHSFFEGFQDNLVSYYAWLDLPEYKKYIETELKKCRADMKKAEERALAAPDSTRKVRRFKELQEQEQLLLKEYDKYEALAKRYEKEVPLAASMFLLSPTETVYMFSGSIREHLNYRGSYAIQWKIIQDSIARKALRYNMHGISGIFDPNDPTYGVFEFKKGFGARAVEYCGDFTYVLMPKMKKIYDAWLGQKK